MKFGVAFLQKTENSPCRVVLLCEKCRKAVFFFFFIHSTSSRRRCTHHHHTTLQLHSSYLLSLQLDALQPVRSPAVRPVGVSPPGVSTFPSEGLFLPPASRIHQRTQLESLTRMLSRHLIFTTQL